MKSKYSLIKRSNVKIDLKHLRSELNCRYHYIVAINRERRHSNHSMKILKGYLSRELYRLPKSEIDFVEKELQLFLKEHEDYIEEEGKKITRMTRNFQTMTRRKCGYGKPFSRMNFENLFIDTTIVYQDSNWMVENRKVVRIICSWN